MLDHAAEPQLFHLELLFQDELNPRHEIDPDGIAALADSIRAVGLIQPLAGRRVGERIGIVAGGRRLAALKSMGDDAPDLVPVVLAPNDTTAEAWATADPVTHRPLHPADEVRAYGRMALTAPVTSIAKAFAVTEAHVKRRLALAALPDAAIDALKKGEITLTAAAVLTTAPSEAVALKVLEEGRGQNLAEHWWRRALHPKGVQPDDRRVRFVGVERYLAEGGSVSQDLFADSAVIHDEALLDKVFARKLTESADALREAEGWGWVETVPETGDWRFEPKGKSRVDAKVTKLPEGDAAEHSDLRQRQAVAGRPLPVDDQARLDDLESRLRDLAFPAKGRGKLGIVVYVDHKGQLGRSNHAWADAKGKKAGTPDDGVEVSNPNPAAEAALSQALQDELRAIRHASLQGALLEQPELATDLLAWSLEGALAAWARPICVTTSAQPAPPEGEDGMARDPRLVKMFGHERPTAEAFAEFRKRSKKARTAILVEAAARALFSPTMGDFYASLQDELKPDPRMLWQPTKANFFGRLRGAMLDAVWAQLFAGIDAEKDEAWAKLKAKEKAEELHQLFNSAEHRAAWGMTGELAAKVAAWMPEVRR